jgi:YbbR domain-containing protein
MSNTLRLFANRLGTVILSLLLAFTVWIAATLQTDPFGPLELIGVPISLLNQPEGTVIFNPSQVSDEANVQVRARQSVLADLRVSEFAATMDLSSAQLGQPNAIPVVVSTTNELIRIQEIEPSTQFVHLEALRTLSSPISIEVEGQVATGYLATRPSLTPDQVTLEGPEPLLAEVTAVTGAVSVEGAKSDLTEEVDVFPVNSDGQVVDGIEWQPTQTEVRIQVRTRVGYKPEVEVVPDIRGDPAPGYRRGNVEVEPSTVTLRGQPSVLEELPGFVVTLPISIGGAIDNLIEQSPITASADVQVVGPDFVTVTIEILPILSSRTITSEVEIEGLRTGWTATPSPNQVDVVLEGPEAVVDGLTSNNIQVLLNLFGYSLGVYRIEPVVLAPEDVTVVNVIPETIEVAIRATPTPTPTGTITATITTQP